MSPPEWAVLSGFQPSPDPFAEAEEVLEEAQEPPPPPPPVARDLPPEEFFPEDTGRLDWADRSKPLMEDVPGRKELESTRLFRKLGEDEFKDLVEQNKNRARTEEVDWFGETGLGGRGRRVAEGMPFSGFITGNRLMDTAMAAYEWEVEGLRTEDGARLIGEFYAELEREGELNKLDRVMELAAQMPGFFVEIGLTGGGYTAVSKGTQKMLLGQLRKMGVRFLKEKVKGVAKRKLLPRAAIKGAGFLAGSAALTALNPQLIAEQTSERALHHALQGDEEAFVKAMWQGPLGAYFELASEMSGGIGAKYVTGYLAKKAGIKKMMEAAASKWLIKNPRSRMAHFLALKNKVGWHGIFEEIEEERLVDIARGLSRIDDDFGTTGRLFSDDPKERAKAWEQIEIEFYAFSLVGGGMRAPGAITAFKKAPIEKMEQFGKNPSRTAWNKIEGNYRALTEEKDGTPLATSPLPIIGETYDLPTKDADTEEVDWDNLTPQELDPKEAHHRKWMADNWVAPLAEAQLEGQRQRYKEHFGVEKPAEEPVEGPAVVEDEGVLADVEDVEETDPEMVRKLKESFATGPLGEAIAQQYPALAEQIGPVIDEVAAQQAYVDQDDLLEAVRERLQGVIEGGEQAEPVAEDPTTPAEEPAREWQVGDTVKSGPKKAVKTGEVVRVLDNGNLEVQLPGEAETTVIDGENKTLELVSPAAAEPEAPVAEDLLQPVLEAIDSSFDDMPPEETEGYDVEAAKAGLKGIAEKVHEEGDFDNPEDFASAVREAWKEAHPHAESARDFLRDLGLPVPGDAAAEAPVAATPEARIHRIRSRSRELFNQLFPAKGRISEVPGIKKKDIPKKPKKKGQPKIEEMTWEQRRAFWRTLWQHAEDRVLDSTSLPGETEPFTQTPEQFQQLFDSIRKHLPDSKIVFDHEDRARGISIQGSDPEIKVYQHAMDSVLEFAADEWEALADTLPEKPKKGRKKPAPAAAEEGGAAVNPLGWNVRSQGNYENVFWIISRPDPSPKADKHDFLQTGLPEELRRKKFKTKAKAEAALADFLSKPAAPAAAEGDLADQARQALEDLGYSPDEAAARVAQVMREAAPELLTLEEIIIFSPNVELPTDIRGDAILALRQQGLSEDAATEKVDELLAKKDYTDAGELVKDVYKREEAAPKQYTKREMVEGDTAEVLVQDGEKTRRIPATYAIVSLGDLTPSHDATMNELGGVSALRNRNYPDNLQPRHDYTEDPQSIGSAKVARHAEQKVPEYYINNVATPLDGPPTVTPEGLVINGNGRVMTLQVAYGEWYEQHLQDNAETYGLTEEQVSEMPRPVLVRVVDMHPESPEAKTFARLGNIGTEQAQSPAEIAASYAQMIFDEDLTKLLDLESGDTIKALISGDKAKDFRKKLRGRMPASQRNEYFNKDGTLNEKGRELVRDMFVAHAFPVELINTLRQTEGVKDLLGNMIGVVPELLAIERSYPQYDTTAALIEAVEWIARHKDTAISRESVELRIGRDLFGELEPGSTWWISPQGRMMLDLLVGLREEGKGWKFPIKLRKKFKGLASTLKTEKGGMFAEDAGPIPETIGGALGVPVREGADFSVEHQPVAAKFAREDKAVADAQALQEAEEKDATVAPRLVESIRAYLEGNEELQDTIKEKFGLTDVAEEITNLKDDVTQLIKIGQEIVVKGPKDARAFFADVLPKEDMPAKGETTEEADSQGFTDEEIERQEEELTVQLMGIMDRIDEMDRQVEAAFKEGGEDLRQQTLNEASFRHRRARLEIWMTVLEFRWPGGLGSFGHPHFTMNLLLKNAQSRRNEPGYKSPVDVTSLGEEEISLLEMTPEEFQEIASDEVGNGELLTVLLGLEKYGVDHLDHILVEQPGNNEIDVLVVELHEDLMGTHFIWEAIEQQGVFVVFEETDNRKKAEEDALYFAFGAELEDMGVDLDEFAASGDLPPQQAAELATIIEAVDQERAEAAEEGLSPAEQAKVDKLLAWAEGRDDVVRDENGEPLIVWHGSQTYDPDTHGKLKAGALVRTGDPMMDTFGVYFTTDFAEATVWAGDYDRTTKTGVTPALIINERIRTFAHHDWIQFVVASAAKYNKFGVPVESKDAAGQLSEYANYPFDNIKNEKTRQKAKDLAKAISKYKFADPMPVEVWQGIDVEAFRQGEFLGKGVSTVKVIEGGKFDPGFGEVADADWYLAVHESGFTQASEVEPAPGAAEEEGLFGADPSPPRPRRPAAGEVIPEEGEPRLIDVARPPAELPAGAVPGVHDFWTHEDPRAGSGRPIAIWSIIRRLSKLPRLFGYKGVTDFPIQTGTMKSPGALGETYWQELMVKIRNADDMLTAFHEIGHAIEVLIFGTGLVEDPVSGKISRTSPWKSAAVGKEVVEELKQLGVDLWGEGKKPKGGLAREGFAEFIRLYLENRAEVQDKAPNALKWFETTVAGRPNGRKALKEMNRIAGMVTSARDQGLLNWARANLVVDPASLEVRYQEFKDMMRLAPNMLVRQFVDSLQPLELFEMQYEKTTGKKLARDKSPYMWGQALRLQHSAVVHQMVNDGMVNFARDLVKGGVSLAQMEKFVKPKDYEDFTIYLVARRSLKLIHNEKMTWDEDGNVTSREPDPLETPMTELQATKIIDKLEKMYPLPGSDRGRFGAGADIFYRWNDGVLQYVAEADPFFGAIVERIRRKEEERGDYAPLRRYMRTMNLALAQHGGPRVSYTDVFDALKGSKLISVVDPIQTAISNAERLILAAHNRKVVMSMISMAGGFSDKLGEPLGFGNLIFQEVRGKELKHAARIESTAKQVWADLKGKGLDPQITDKRGLPMELDEVDFENKMIEFYGLALTPKSGEPIIPVMDESGTVRWYKMEPAIYQAVQSMSADGLEFLRKNNWARWAVDIIGIMPRHTARLFRAGTVGFRASFGLVTNPLRDFQTLYLNTASSANGLTLFTNFVLSFGEEFVSAITGGRVRSKYSKLWLRLGGRMALPLAQDTDLVAQSARDVLLSKNIGKRVVRYVTDPARIPRHLWNDWKSFLSFWKDFLQFPESATRMAEIRTIAAEIGWKPGDTMTPEIAQHLILAGKQVTVDFTAAGDISRAYNQYVPFFNAAIQGPRAAIRAARRPVRMGKLAGVPTGPVHFATRGLQLAGLAIANWFRNKDEDWWIRLNAREKFLYMFYPTNILGEDVVVMIPMAHDSGQLFAGLAVAFLDAWYRREPDEVLKWAELQDYAFTIAESHSPVDIPWDFERMKVAPSSALGKGWQTVMELGMNRKSYFGTPVVSSAFLGPGGRDRIPREQQYNEYTTVAARWLANLAGMSPVEVDHAITSVAGPAARDYLMAGQSLDQLFTGKKLQSFSDVPILGRVFRRGGKAGSRTRPVNELYDVWEFVYTRHGDRVRSETPEENREYMLLGDATRAVSLLFHIRAMTKDETKRREISNKASELAESALENIDTMRLDRDPFRMESTMLEREEREMRMFRAYEQGNIAEGDKLRDKLYKQRKSAKSLLMRGFPDIEDATPAKRIESLYQRRRAAKIVYP